MANYDPNFYRNKPQTSVVFEKDNVFVVEFDAPEPIGKHWSISDGDVMFSVGEMPKLEYDNLVKEIAEYKFGKSQDVEDDGFDDDYEHKFTEELV